MVGKLFESNPISYRMDRNSREAFKLRDAVKKKIFDFLGSYSDDVLAVHFAASREALLSHFSTCGAVAKVVMLTDTITAQPKGAAYIVFANKESVDKAVAMSRTSFFSRVLTVMRKADMPSDFLVPSQSATKLVQPFHAQPFWKGSGQRNYGSTHLQWRRENPTNRENTTSTAANRLESSTPAE